MIFSLNFNSGRSENFDIKTKKYELVVLLGIYKKKYEKKLLSALVYNVDAYIGNGSMQ